MNKLIKTQDVNIVDLSTGENLPITSASPEQISAYLADINFKKKQIDAVEKAIKKFAETKLEFEDNEGRQVAYFGKHRILKTYRSGFSEKLFDKLATPEEKAVWDSLKNDPKFTLATEYLKWQ